VFWSFAAFTPKVDTKVVSTPTMAQNGVIVLVNCLELSLPSEYAISDGISDYDHV